ncbi:hypothetical protein CYMTET_28703, partial [Cymbomonas tetramitiformis]
MGQVAQIAVHKLLANNPNVVASTVSRKGFHGTHTNSKTHSVRSFASASSLPGQVSRALRWDGQSNENYASRKRHIAASSAREELTTPPSEEQPGATTWEIVVKVIVFILPATANMLLGPVLSMIDTIFVGRANLLELAALGPATTVSDITAYLFSWLGVGTITFLAQATSLGNQDEVDRYTRTALYLAVTCGFGDLPTHSPAAIDFHTALTPSPAPLLAMAVSDTKAPLALLTKPAWCANALHCSALSEPAMTGLSFKGQQPQLAPL